MRLHIIAVGQKMPEWVNTAFNHYQKRFPSDMPLNLIEIPAGKRSKKADIQRILHKEGLLMQQAIPRSTHIVTLEVEGRPWDTPKLAKNLQRWQNNGKNVAFLIGGPEGLAENCVKLSHEKWSLSALTLPHPMVRVIAAEALFRAWSLTANHPYHRE